MIKDEEGRRGMKVVTGLSRGKCCLGKKQDAATDIHAYSMQRYGFEPRKSLRGNGTCIFIYMLGVLNTITNTVKSYRQLFSLHSKLLSSTMHNKTHRSPMELCSYRNTVSTMHLSITLSCPGSPAFHLLGPYAEMSRQKANIASYLSLLLTEESRLRSNIFCMYIALL